MLSKCANPDCQEQFRYLHQGKLFQLSPVPELQQFTEESYGSLYERFWLCDKCCRNLTVIWDGFRAQVAPLPREKKTSDLPRQEESSQTLVSAEDADRGRIDHHRRSL
jgi:hypothetical protein